MLTLWHVTVVLMFYVDMMRVHPVHRPSGLSGMMPVHRQVILAPNGCRFNAFGFDLDIQFLQIVYQLAIDPQRKKMRIN